MTFSRRNLKKRYATRKHGPMSRNRTFKRQSMKNYMRHRAKGFYLRPPHFLPIPPPRAPSLPIPPPQPPSPPKSAPSFLPIPPPRPPSLPIPPPIPPPPSPLHSSPPSFGEKKPEQKKPEQKKPEQKKPEQKKPEQKKPEQKKPEQKPEPTVPQQRRSLRQVIMNSDKNKKIKRR
jgi:hypothetical protein